MRPGNHPGAPLEEEEDEEAEEWKQLLQILQSADSPVGAAIHWVESQGGYGSGTSCVESMQQRGRPRKRRKVREWWRFVPNLLASEIAFVEREEEGTGQKWGRVGNCIWMQTLPSAMQANILTFLNVEHRRFRTKDLELLARHIVSSPVEPEFWVSQAARTLLNTVDHTVTMSPSNFKEPCKLGAENAEMEGYDALPDWLHNYKEPASSSFSGLPIVQSSIGKEEMQLQEKALSIEELEFSECRNQKATSENHQGEARSVHVSVPCLQESIGHTDNGNSDVMAIPTQETVEDKLTPKSDLIVETREEQINGLEAEFGGTGSQSDSHLASIMTEERNANSDLGKEGYLQALSLRQALHSHQGSGLSEEVRYVRLTPNLSMFLSVVRLWEVDDQVTLSLVESLLTYQDGYAWSTQILNSIFLKKLLDLEKPPSRLLITALAQAGKSHPRATVDAVVFPLICSERGASNIQCEVINRMVNDCFPEEMITLLCQKVFVAWEDKVPAVNSEVSWMWTEGMIGVVQNLLNHKLDIDQQTIAGLVCALDSAVADFSSSLKFGNLLLNVFTKYGAKLKLHKAVLQQVANRTKTFLTKSLLTKLTAL